MRHLTYRDQMTHLGWGKEGVDDFVILPAMKSLIHFFRTNKIARLFLVVLVLLSFFGLAAHHHEADHATHDCPVCRVAQLLIAVVVSMLVFLWVDTVRISRAIFDHTPNSFSAFHGAILANRAPPIFA